MLYKPCFIVVILTIIQRSNHLVGNSHKTAAKEFLGYLQTLNFCGKRLLTLVFKNKQWILESSRRLPEGWARFREGKRGGGNGPRPGQGQGGKKYNMARIYDHHLSSLFCCVYL